MKQVYPVILLSSLLIFPFSCKTKEGAISNKDILASQRILGIELNEKYLDPMAQYLARNKAGYDSLRMYPISNEVFPALQFDPHPASSPGSHW